MLRLMTVRLAGALICCVLFASACTGSADDGPRPQQRLPQARAVADARVGAVPEARPFMVPTAPATDPLNTQDPSKVLAGERARSVPWELIRMWDSGRRLAIQYSPGCSTPDAGQIRFEETATDVLVQALGDPSSKRCLRNVRVALALSRPLGSRELLHAATRPPVGDAADRRPLAERYDNATETLVPQWYRNGQEVLLSALVQFRGAAHCNWESATYLSGSALGSYRDSRGTTWVRDPLGVLEHFPLAKRDFRARATLPKDARFTGYEQGAVEVWTAASDRGDYVYLVNSLDRQDVERWVRGGGVCD